MLRIKEKIMTQTEAMMELAKILRLPTVVSATTVKSRKSAWKFEIHVKTTVGDVVKLKSTEEVVQFATK